MSVAAESITEAITLEHQQEPARPDLLAHERVQRVLLADDDVDLLRVLLHRVTADRPGPQRVTRYEVHTALSGDVALQLAMSLHFDVLLLDVQMPGLSGVEVTRAIRRQQELWQPAIVLISAFADAEGPQEALQAGADAVVHKPFTLATLREGIQQASWRRTRCTR
ncbi:response regulator [Kineococcus arenarius]|uniref:response regulator n=1 Tax=Kineococcus sp. SYSU DK007 TaxID=3383128 RepID=UPI003D7D9BA7